MKERLKSLFVYKESTDNDFELLESQQESEAWDRNVNKKTQDEKKGVINQEGEEVKSRDNNSGNEENTNDEGSSNDTKDSKGTRRDSDSSTGESKDNSDKSGKTNKQKNQKNKFQGKTPVVIRPVSVEQLVKDKNAREKKSDKGSSNNQAGSEQNQKCVSTKLDDNLKYLKELFHSPKNQDVIFREFNIARKIPAFMVFIDGMVDKHIIAQFSLPQLMDVHHFNEFEGGCPLDYIEKNVLPVNQIDRMNNFREIVQQILSGLTVLFIDGCDQCLVMESRGFEKRDIGNPVTETVVQGAQEGFTENLRTNITLVRRIVKNENLIAEFNFVSKTNNFLAAILYIENLTNKKIVEEVKRRIKNLDINYISGSGMLEQLVEDKNYMLFPQVISTERPDRAASFLAEGKVVLICEGTPFALAMPITFFDLFHTSEETNLRWQYGTFLRIIRLIGLLIATFLPGVWTSLTLFHQEMIPTALLSSIVVARSPVPFPFIAELLLMELSFELIREGGIRVPGVTGNALGIIGALILGQATVAAGLVSPILIIIVAVTGLGNFAVPNYSLALAIRIIRFVIIFFGAVSGLYGVSVIFAILSGLALNMKSFGVPFFSPISPKTKSNQDIVIRGLLNKQTWRPDFLNPHDIRRMSDNPREWAKRRGNKNVKRR